jgi:peptide/nickel transport system permease protein
VGLASYIARRAIYSAVLLIFVLTLNFAIFAAMPGDPVAILASTLRLKPEQVTELMGRFGLDEPLWNRYVKYIQAMLTFQFGYSYFYMTPVSKLILERLPNTILLMGISTIFAIMAGTLLGAIAAYKRGKKTDTSIVVGSLLTYALPTFWMGMVFLLVFAYYLPWFPLAGTMSRPPPEGFLPMVMDVLWHLFLPGLTLFLFFYGGFALLSRSSTLEVLTEDYITTARAKGLSERTVLFKHALRNALLPITTQAAIYLGLVVQGAIITEAVFTWSGLGHLTWQAIQFKDYPVLQAVFYVFALSMIVANFMADILYGFLDPRIRYE